jgi:sporulation-control protein spo0M
MTPAQVDAVIAQIEDEASRIRAQIEWEYASQFQRAHPLVTTLSAALGLTPEQVDEMWASAAQL